jgi:hypothetical protein
MRYTAQRSFDAAQEQHRYIGVEVFQNARVDVRCIVGAKAAFAARRVRIARAPALARGIVVDHRIHVARRHAEEQARCAERLEGFSGAPVRLRDDADAKALGFEQAADHGHAEARMVHIGVAGDENHVELTGADTLSLKVVQSYGNPSLCVEKFRHGGRLSTETARQYKALLTVGHRKVEVFHIYAEKNRIPLRKFCRFLVFSN